MPDTLAELGKDFGRSRRTLESVKRRSGLLPALERSRGSAAVDGAYTAAFSVGQNTRRVSLRISFSPPQEPLCDIDNTPLV